jgi:hypothetical protein
MRCKNHRRVKLELTWIHILNWGALLSTCSPPRPNTVSLGMKQLNNGMWRSEWEDMWRHSQVAVLYLKLTPMTLGSNDQSAILQRRQAERYILQSTRDIYQLRFVCIIGLDVIYCRYKPIVAKLIWTTYITPRKIWNYLPLYVVKHLPHEKWRSE